MGISAGNDWGPFLEQDFKADVEAKPTANENGFWVTLSNIREVTTLTVDPDGAIATATYPTFDIVATQIGLRMGAAVILQVKPENDTRTPPLSYKVSSLHKDPETGAVTLDAWNTGGPTAAAGAFVGGANVSVTILSPLLRRNKFSLSRWECKNLRCQAAIYNSNSNSETGTISISDVSGSEAPATSANNDLGLVAFLINLTGLIKGREPLIIRAKRAGCNNVKTMIGIVDRIRVDGKGIELRISKKGLKSKGCAAKKAVAGFTNGVYKLQSIQLVRFHPAVSPSDSWSPSDWSPSNSWVHLPIAGTLTKTGDMGEAQLRFGQDAKERVYSYDEEKKEVSSMSANDYLVQVAERIGAGLLVAFETGPGAPAFIGVLSGLTRSNPGGQMVSGWIATVNTSFDTAAESAEYKVIGILFYPGDHLTIW